MSTAPDKNTAHVGDIQAQRYGVGWAKREISDNDVYQTNNRECSYCGSIHPEDLLRVMRGGARVTMADIKYVVPHKLYVSGIPNLNAGRKYKQYAYCGVQPPSGDWEEYETGSFSPSTGKPVTAWRMLTATPLAPVYATAKFYLAHLTDMNADDFEELARRLQSETGYRFMRCDNGHIRYEKVEESACA